MNLLSLVSSRLPALRNALGATLLFAVLPHVNAASYYVDYASGSDTNAGTSTSAPWKHCPGDPAGTGSAAAASLVAGDVVTFKGGVSYLFTATSGIALRWSGSATAPITYDGNSAGAWGTGRATFTDNRGSTGLSAFASAGGASNLAFKNLEFSAIGGSATLPADLGTPVAARFGGGIAFNGSATGVTIDGCDFHDLGYTFAQRPMSADSILGNGIVFRDCNGLTISNCTFARAAVGIQMTGSAALTKMKITNCTFSDAMVRTINQPPEAATSEVSISGCVDSTGSQFDRLVWSGYGASPRVVVKEATEGATVTLDATAIATPGATFQWLKNGTALPSALTSRLTLSSATIADSGVYSVIATNSSGSTVSNDAVVTITAASGLPTIPTTPPTNPVSSAPVITVQPADTTVPAFATATFSVVATGSPAPTYQWKRNGISIAGWTGATLALEGVSSNDIGSYSVVVTNSSGSVTSTAAILSIGAAQPVAVAPAITTPPVGQTVNTAATVTFTVAASGTPAPSLQWLKNGAPLSGRTGSTLTLTNVATTDAGSYAVTATNSAGTVTSASATLVVLVPTTAPVFATQPANQTVAPLGTATFVSLATGTPAPTYQWKRNGISIPGWTSATLVLEGVSSNDVGTYSVVATNSAGSATSNGAILSVGSAPTTPTTPTTPSTPIGAPVVVTQPANQTVATNATATFSVSATGNPAPTYQWKRNGIAFTGWTGATLSLEGVSTNDIGTYSVVVTNSAGSVTSTGALLSIASAAGNGAPAFTKQPANQTVAPFGTATFTATASGSPTYQWKRDGVSFPGWTGATLTLEGVSTNDQGYYSVTATNSAGSTTSAPALLTVKSPSTAASLVGEPDSRLVNLSVRSKAGSGNESLIAGFVVSGDAGKSVLVRASGPALAGFGVEGTLADPSLALYTGSTPLAANDDWSTAANARELNPLGQSLGAFAFATQSSDSALTKTLAAGAYTAQLTGRDGDTGVALLELYDAARSSSARLVNVSVRTVVSDSNTPIIGFSIEGSAPKRLLVRAVGPGLASFGVEGTLADPQIELFRDGASVQRSDNWGGTEELNAAFQSVGAFALSDRDSKDAAAIVTAAPGTYSVVISGASHTSGTVIVEVYELP